MKRCERERRERREAHAFLPFPGDSTPIITTFLEDVMRNVDTKTSPHPPKSCPLVSPHTDTLITNRPCRPRRPESEMRPRDGGRLNAWPRPLRDPGLTSPLPKKYTTATRRETEANRPKGQDRVKRFYGEGASEYEYPQPLTGEHRPPPFKNISSSKSTDKYSYRHPPDPTEYSHNPASHRH